MSTFIRVAEVWVPSAEGGVLELADGIFEAAPAFGALSRRLCFARGEGLPGRAWDEGRPILLREFAGSYFRRIEAAQDAGLGCALALPWFVGDVLTSVVVLFAGQSGAHTGAMELWHNDPRITGDLTLSDGFFGTADPSLESLTREAYLPRGVGLPGLAWQRDATVFMDQLPTSPRFLRSAQAASAGVVRGLAWPGHARNSREAWVACILASAASPMAQAVEVWQPVGGAPPGEPWWYRTWGYCEPGTDMVAGEATARPQAQLGVLARVVPTACARIGRGAAALGPSEPPVAAQAAVLAMPTSFQDGLVSEVTVLHF